MTKEQIKNLHYSIRASYLLYKATGSQGYRVAFMKGIERLRMEIRQQLGRIK